MEIVRFIREFITHIYRFAMHILDFFENDAEPMKLEYSRAASMSSLPPQNMDLDLDRILDEIIENTPMKNTENTYTPLYFDNLTYSDFVNTNAPEYQPSFFGGNSNYMNDLFFATKNDETLDINRPFFDNNIERCRLDDLAEAELAAASSDDMPDLAATSSDDLATETSDDMPDLVSISSHGSNTNIITPLTVPQDDADDFVCSDEIDAIAGL